MSSGSECKERSSRREANNKILDDKYNNFTNDDSRSHTSSPGFIEVLNTSCSSCSGKDQHSQMGGDTCGGGPHIVIRTTRVVCGPTGLIKVGRSACHIRALK